MPNAGGRNEPCHPLHHSEARSKNWNQRQLLAAYAFADRALEWRFDGCRLQRELTRCLVSDKRCDLVHELFKNLRRRSAIAQQRELMLDERMRDNAQRRKRGGGVHVLEATNFARMKEYQAVMLRLSRHARDDEDALTDLLNERSRGGWCPSMMAQDDHRITIIFERPGDGEG